MAYWMLKILVPGVSQNCQNLHHLHHIYIHFHTIASCLEGLWIFSHWAAWKSWTYLAMSCGVLRRSKAFMPWSDCGLAHMDADHSYMFHSVFLHLKSHCLQEMQALGLQSHRVSWRPFRKFIKWSVICCSQNNMIHAAPRQTPPAPGGDTPQGNKNTLTYFDEKLTNSSASSVYPATCVQCSLQHELQCARLYTVRWKRSSILAAKSMHFTPYIERHLHFGLFMTSSCRRLQNAGIYLQCFLKDEPQEYRIQLLFLGFNHLQLSMPISQKCVNMQQYYSPKSLPMVQGCIASGVVGRGRHHHHHHHHHQQQQQQHHHHHHHHHESMHFTVSPKRGPCQLNLTCCQCLWEKEIERETCGFWLMFSQPPDRKACKFALKGYLGT